MLIRVVFENVFSFGSRIEFSTIPNNRLKTLENHAYSHEKFEVLKMSSIYGANGAGKSNLVKSIELLQTIVTQSSNSYKYIDTNFKFNKSEKAQTFAVEFISNSTSYIYALEITGTTISTEELYESGLGEQEDILIYKRETNKEKESSILFHKAFENDEKSQLLKSVLIEEFVKHDETILKFISKRDNEFLKITKDAYNWFSSKLQIITPNTRPAALAHRIDIDPRFKSYAKDLMCSLNIGINDLSSEKKSINEFFGEDDQAEIDKLTQRLNEQENSMLGIRNSGGDEVVIVKEDDQIWVKQIKIDHKGGNNQVASFDLDEESDGTMRLLDLIPAFRDVISSDDVFIIDEIERSIHPLLIKELVKKFSLDEKTKGQLIFTTHESNLLDQSIFRQDEIWFAEKDSFGSTDLYSLNDFKEHKTIDIRKGYLNGRYGSIPFLGNIHDLNWHGYDIDE